MKSILVLFAAIGAYVIASTMDYDNAVTDAKYYCDMVLNGYWGNFNEQIKCGEKHGY